jgi:hypothetical protein
MRAVSVDGKRNGSGVVSYEGELGVVEEDVDQEC